MLQTHAQTETNRSPAQFQVRDAYPRGYLCSGLGGVIGCSCIILEICSEKYVVKAKALLSGIAMFMGCAPV